MSFDIWKFLACFAKGHRYRNSVRHPGKATCSKCGFRTKW